MVSSPQMWQPDHEDSWASAPRPGDICHKHSAYSSAHSMMAVVRDHRQESGPIDRRLGHLEVGE